MLMFETTPGHGVLEVGDLSPNPAKLRGDQDKVGVVAVDQVEQLLRSPESNEGETPRYYKTRAENRKFDLRLELKK